MNVATMLPAAAVPRVVIDTNAVLDWLVFAEPAALALRDAIASRRCDWCATPAMLGELRAVLNRPLPERWESARKLALTIDLDRWPTPPGALQVPPVTQRLICRDPADQMFIDLALCCAPAWLVTRDRALLALRRRAALQGVIVATPEQWQQRHATIAITAED
jgi:predicted nucleic acid-binding protein